LDADFTILYQKYKNTIFSYIYYLCGDYAAAEEICQDVFLKVYLNISKFEGRSSFKTWIYKIAKNTYLDFMKNEAKNRNYFKQNQDFDQERWIQESGPEDHVLNREVQERIQKTLRQMSDKYCMLIILRDMQHLSYKEISEILGQNLNSTKVNIYRARKEFRQIYERLEGK
jgi:RNA polymerase sigma-70 factor (ECF subfamily)